MKRIRQNQQQDDSGFTLIELLIVIVVLGVLAGIAIFAVGTFQDDAEDACNEANARITATVDEAAKASSKGSSAYTVSGTSC